MGYIKKTKTIFVCQNCSYQTLKWLGRCPDCNEWNTFVEETIEKKEEKKTHKKKLLPLNIATIESEEDRIITGMQEVDRTLGGGIVAGSIILIGGEPGIGKSTLMLQILTKISSNESVLYISGEESLSQLKLRYKRLNRDTTDKMFAISEIDLEKVISICEEIKPKVITIDSIQTMFSRELSSPPGSITQVREATMKLMLLAKKINSTIFIVGHVTKDGAIAGPRVMEHIVDTVLYFEGDKNNIFRILRANKNRFGSTNEIGVFEMQKKGLVEIFNPSEIFLSEKPENVAGSVVTATIEGTRPILIEIQGLVSISHFATAKRTILGIDQNKVALLIAIIEKRLAINLVGNDVFMNIAGGIKSNETALDLGIISALISSFLDKKIPDDTVVFGEVGLAGEIRAVNHIVLRISEIKKMGFKKCIIPFSNLKSVTEIKDIEIVGIKNISELMTNLF